MPLVSWKGQAKLHSTSQESSENKKVTFSEC